MRLKASVLVCVLAVAMCFLLSGVVHSTPCERTDPQEWEPSDSDPRSYAATVERFQSELEAYGYASVFRQLQSDLEIWIYENGTDDPHTHLLEAFRTLNTRFADYERRLAELVSVTLVAEGRGLNVSGADPVDAAIALHQGEVSYGNVGISGRLDFTVTGPAVNKVARLEGLSKQLGRRVVASASFAKLVPGRLVSLGRYALRGVSDEREVFSLETSPGPE